MERRVATGPSRLRLHAGLLVVVGLALAVLVPIPVLTSIPAQAATTSGCMIEDASLTWGFKESFRSYISGVIARGEWTTANGASYATPDFSWSTGTGAVNKTRVDGRVIFDGSITFTGHGGILNTTVANPVIQLSGGTGELLLDVTGTTQDGDVVDAPSVAFARLDLSGGHWNANGHTATVSDVPVTLLASGATAFGTYEAGEPFDPITLSMTTRAECSDVAWSSPSDVAAGAPFWLGWLGGGIIALAIGSIVAAVVVTVRRRRV